MTINVLAIDLAKDVFQLHGNDVHGRAVLRKKLRRSQLSSFVAQLPPCTIAMEACGGSHYWARLFKSLGHEIRLISPQFVKPFVKSNKNDAADAEAIAEAAVRPGMRFVPVKDLWQQEILFLHRVRERLVANRTALTNEIRGFLQEHGVTMPRGSVRKRIGELLAAADDTIPQMTRKMLEDLIAELFSLDDRIKSCDQKIEIIFQSHESCKRIGAIEGIGPVTATALVASIGDPRQFRNGRDLSAWLGLVPRQRSSGGKTVLLGISKRGDRYLRKLLVHGARSAIRYAHLKDTRRSRWVLEKVKTRGANKACVALANHNARVVWALLAKGEAYKPN